MNKCLDEILIAALDIHDSIDRTRFLKQVCHGDSEMLAEVQDLLDAYHRMGDFLTHPLPPSTLLESLPGLPADEELVGTTIGTYQIASLIGRGGMGSVYRATQKSPICREVAIKVIRSDLVTRETLARFDHEREVLSLMDHPNIARVLDAGTTVRGEPYLVMEWVDGESITAYCAKRQLNVRERIQLLTNVCGAVHHAHQKGIIHRDLKPSNVLIKLLDGLAIPKIIDFGIAKATTAAILENSDLTLTGQILGTPNYMAPEQVDRSNLDVDTRADIYSLGAMAYELLTDSPPFRAAPGQSISLSERLRLIKEVEPERPSVRWLQRLSEISDDSTQRTKHSSMDRVIEDELDWIVLKCLEKDRDRRYESCNSLEQDFLRYLSGSQVMACPPTLRYRISKFARKYRTGLAMASVFTIVLLLTTALSLRLALRANQLHGESQSHLQEARTNLRLAIDAVDQFCTKVSDDLRLNEQDLRPLRRDLLNMGVVFHEQLLEYREHTSEAKIDLANAYKRLAELSMAIESPSQASQYFLRAIEEYHNLTDEQRTEEVQYDVARCWQQLARLQIGANRTEEVYRSAERSLKIYQGLKSSSPEKSRQVLIAVAEVSLLQGAIAYAVNDLDRADKFNRIAIEEWTFLAKASPNNPEVLTQLANAHSKNARALLSRGLSKWREAEAEFRHALELVSRIDSEAKKGSLCQQVRAECFLQLGKIAKVTGKSDEALEYLMESLEIFRTLEQQQPSVISHKTNVTFCYGQLASLYRLDGDLAKSKEYLTMCQQMLTPLVYPESKSSVAEQQLAEVLDNLADFQAAEGDGEGALASLNKAVMLLENIMQKEPQMRVSTEQAPFLWQSRGKILLQLNRLEESLQDYDRAIEGAKSALRIEYRLERCEVLTRLSRYEQAIEELRSCLTPGLPTETIFHPSQYVTGARRCMSIGLTASADPKVSESQQQKLHDDCYRQAVMFLAASKNAGYAEFAALRDDSAFAPLSDRDDFRLLFP